MNLYFRLLLLFFKIKRNRDYQSLLDTVDIDYKALPSDCDINLHLTNSRYLAMMDLSRTWMTERVGLLKQIMKRRWFPIVNATAILPLVRVWLAGIINTFILNKSFIQNVAYMPLLMCAACLKVRKGWSVLSICSRLQALTGLPPFYRLK